VSHGELLALGRDAVEVALLVAGPLLLAALVVGTLVSLVQAVTQVHEQTLTFLPKLLAMAVVLAVAGGWMLEQTVAYAERSFHRIAYVSER
jgi:flagellar biosynthetic protein FliQ